MTSEHWLEHLSPHLLDRGPEAGWTSSSWKNSAGGGCVISNVFLRVFPHLPGEGC